ncbi:MAG: dUTP diphosphatase [Candidatus Saccharimonadota bacterium]
MKMDVVKLRDDAVLPVYQTAGAAGADLHACIDEPIVLQPLERRVIPTGLAMSIPEGYEVQIRARSGMSIKHGITMVNGIGTIDADYRGEVGALVINLGQEAFTIEPGMRIAQMVVAKYEVTGWNVVESLDETERGTGGYGSSGAH